VVLRGTKDIRIEQIGGREAGPDDVVIRPRAVGICGSDIDMYRGVYTGLWKLPTVMGHEFSGEVLEVGSNVRRIAVGQRVTAEEIHWCGYCRPCAAGFPNYCENVEELGFTEPGALAEEVVIHQRYVHTLPSNVSYEAGSVVEPTSVAYTGIFVQGGGLTPGDFVAVFGAGPIGLLASMLAKVAGAEVAVFEPNGWRRKMAESIGADHVFDPLETDAVRTVRDLTGGYGANMALECSANENVVPTVVDCLRFRGRGVLIGMLEKPSTIQGVNFVRRGISLAGSLGHSGHDTFPHVINLVGRGEIDPTRLISHRFSVWEPEQALSLAAQRGNSMKITLTQ
jgi:threonine dehydrogenase-like Zn-dependent dehydrogenase